MWGWSWWLPSRQDDRSRGQEGRIFFVPNTAKNNAENGHYCLALLPTHYVITSTVNIARRQAIESFETEMTDAVRRMDGGRNIRFFMYIVCTINM